MTEQSDRIPFVEIYRGVGIHDRQSDERIVGVVKPAIDAVLAMDKVERLAAYASNTAKPPEARVLAAARIEAMWELAAESREVRPNIDIAVVRASVAGLQSQKWRDPRHYGSLLDVRDPPGQRRQIKR